jgi:hypothetical protein
LSGSGSGSDFSKRPFPDQVLDPEPDLNKFSAKFLLEIFAEICSKRYFHDKKVKQQRFLKYLWFLNIPKKLR